MLCTEHNRATEQDAPGDLSDPTEQTEHQEHIVVYSPRQEDLMSSCVQPKLYLE